MTGTLTIDPIIPVPITSPIQAIINLFVLLYSTPDKNAPNTAPVSANGGIDISDILIIPINVAHNNAYHGPKNTAHTIFTKCCVGQNPTTLKIGDITTPIATNIDSIIIFTKVELFLFIKPPLFTTLYLTINQYFFTIKNIANYCLK